VERKRLIINQIPADFDFAKDVPLAPRCFHSMEENFPGWEDLSFIDIYEDPKEIDIDAEKVRRYADSLVESLVPEFNAMHGRKYSYEYWRVLLLPWVILIMQSVWKNFRNISEFVRVYSDVNLEVEIAPLDVNWHYFGLIEFSKILCSNDFQFWVASQIISRIGPENWQKKIISAEKLRTRWPDKERLSLRRVLYNFILFGLRCRCVYGIKLPIAFLLSLFLSVLPSKKGRSAQRRVAGLGEAEAEFPIQFCQLIKEILPRVIPESLKRVYPELDNWAMKFRFRPGKIQLVGPVGIYNEREKFYLAHAIENRELVVGTQHGGSGYQKVNINSVAIENTQYAYFSWGFKKQSNYPGRIIPVPSPYLAHFHNRHRKKEDSLFLVGTSARIHGNRLETAVQSINAIRYRKEELSFLKALSPEIFSSTFYRPFPGNDPCGLKGEYYIRTHFPAINILYGDLNKKMLSTKLVVVDYPGASLVIAMAANIPLIIFWDLNNIPVARQAEPIFEEMRRVGLFHMNGTKAASHVNKIWDNVEEWWNSREVQQVRKQFCENYARTKRLWWYDWCRELFKL